MDINNEKHRITANEINKFCYCKYQWFYERVYGRKELGRMKKELNEKLGLEDERLSAFNYGSGFHKGVVFGKNVAKKAVVIVFILMLVALFIYLRMKNIV